MTISIRLASSPAERNFAEDLLVASFPSNERPPLELLRQRPASIYHLSLIVADDTAKPVGIFGYWTFSNSVYVEHFAIVPELQGKGYGKAAFSYFLDITHGQVFGEVEPPVDNDTRRRVRFYEQLGLCRNPQPYFQPDYDQWLNGKKEMFPLVIFSKTPLTDSEFLALKTELYQTVYHYNEALQQFEI